MKITKFRGSIYARFLSAFIGAFLITMIIPVIGMVYIQTSHFVENCITKEVSDRTNNLKELISNHGLSVDDAIRIIKTDEIDIYKWNSLQDTGMTLSKAQISEAQQGKVITSSPSNKNRQQFAVFKAGNTWICVYANNKNNLVSVFQTIQIYTVVMPVILGTILLLFAAINVAKPIKRLSVASKRVADGDLSVEISAKVSGELRELIDNFNNMVKKLSENEYLHKEFVSNVSHEFNTPITSLKGYAKLLKKKSLTDEKRDEYADIIIYESDRLSRLCKDLLRLSELENSGKIVSQENFALDEQIREAVVLLQHAWEDKKIDIDLDLDEILYLGDKSLMYHVWINIISNAVKYTDENGKINICLKQDNGIIVTVADNGIGMAKEDLEKVFLRFYKTDKARNSSGSGLGLSIAKKIVELHKGSIQVDSKVKQGTTFTVRLP